MQNAVEKKNGFGINGINGFVKVVDVDELADALENGDISTPSLCEALRKLNRILAMIYSGDFEKMKDFVESFE